MAVHLAECCNPLPGERIVGIVTTGKGVTIHTIDCDTLESFSDTPERWLDLAWEADADEKGVHVGRLNLVVANETGSLSKLTTAIAKNNGNISNLKITNRSLDFFEMLVDIEVKDARHLGNIVAALAGSDVGEQRRAGARAPLSGTRPTGRKLYNSGSGPMIQAPGRPPARGNEEGDGVSQAHQTRLAGQGNEAPSAVLTDRETGSTVELPVLEGTMGPPVIDIRSLYAGDGQVLLRSRLYRDRLLQVQDHLHRRRAGRAAAPRLPYRRAGRAYSDFLEVSYLLLHGELPNAAEKDHFVSTITKHTMVHEQINYLYRGFRRDSHPMAVMIGVVGALAAFYHDTTDINDPKQRIIASHRLIAKMPTFAAMAYKYNIGQPFVYPRNDLTYAENFLHMMFAGAVRGLSDQPDPCARHGPHPDPPCRPRAERLDVDGAPRRLLRRQSLRLHRSRHRDALGPGPRRRQRGRAADAGRDRHGREHPGLPQAGEGQGRPVPPHGLRPPGLQETTTRGPRSCGDTCHEVLDDLGISDELLRIAMELERIALEDEYFVERKLYPNVDFYSGLILQALGIPTRIFTVIFALARTVGWVAQWNEMIADPEQKIGRPRQLYTGPAQRGFVPLRDRP